MLCLCSRLCQTRILVTHGIAFLPQVDQIIVLQDGRISEVCLIDEHYSAAPSYNRYDNFVACKKPLNISALAWAFPRPRLNMRPGTKRERFSPAGKYEAWSKASRQEACKLFRTVISSRTQWISPRPVSNLPAGGETRVLLHYKFWVIWALPSRRCQLSCQVIDGCNNWTC